MNVATCGVTVLLSVALIAWGGCLLGSLLSRPDEEGEMRTREKVLIALSVLMVIVVLATGRAGNSPSGQDEASSRTNSQRP